MFYFVACVNMEPGPPKKSRRIAKKKRSEQAQVDQSTNVSTTVSTSNNQNFQNILVAAVPLITQNVISVLEQKGVINSTNSTPQHTMGTEAQINNQPTDISTSNVPDNSTDLLINSDTNVALAPQQFVLPGSQDIPLVDLSPTISNNACATQNELNYISVYSKTAVYPQNTLSSPLTLHLELKVKSQIWLNTYINFDLLLPKNSKHQGINFMMVKKRVQGSQVLLKSNL